MMKKNKNRSSITVKLLIIVLGLLISTIAILSYFNEQNQKNKYINHTDEKLKMAIYATNEYMMHEYHDKILDDKSIKDNKYHEFMLEISSFVNKTDLMYVYSFIKRGDKVLFTSTSVTKEDFDAANYEEFFEEYVEASEKVINAFETKEIVREETLDKYGYVRTIMIPFENRYGEVYLVGADIDMKELKNEINQTRTYVIMLGTAIFIISALLYLFFSKRLLRRIPIIRNSLEEFFDYLNSKTDSVSKIKMRGSDELNAMADMINDSIESIGANIKKDNQLIKEIAEISSGVKTGTFSAKIEKEGNNPALNEVRDIFNDVLEDMQNVMLDILNVLRDFRKQNYNSKLQDYDLDGEVGKLVEQMNIFGKTISNKMLNTAYDSLNLGKDSKFTTDYMFDIKKRFGEYLKSANSMKEDVDNLTRYNSKSIQKLELVNKENEFLETSFTKVIDDFNELSKFFNNEGSAKILEKFDDLSHSLEVLKKYLEDIEALNKMSSELFAKVNNEINDLDENIVTGSNSIDQMQKVSNNLNTLSEKMKEQIENAQFHGKDNIMMLMNHSER